MDIEYIMEKTTLGKPKTQKDKLVKPTPKSLSFPNLKGTRTSKKVIEIKYKEILTSSEF